MTSTTRVFFLDNQTIIDGFPAAFVAGSLNASLNSGAIEIRRAQSSFLFTSIQWQAVADINGNTFASSDAVMAYLGAQLEMRRSLDVPSATGIAATNLPQGMPVAVSRVNGQLIAARADAVGGCFVAGLASADVAAGFIGNATRNAITVPEWTAVAGTSSLAVGQPYFLGPAGGMTTTPPTSATSLCSVRLGQATAALTFLFSPSDPISL